MIITILSIALICIWVAYLFEGRNEMNRRERLSEAFVFQWNVLPLIVALELLVTGKVLVLIVGFILFFVAWPFAKFLIALLPFAVGMHLGVEWSTLMTMNTIQMYTVGFFSAIALSILCQFVYVAMLSPPRAHWQGH